MQALYSLAELALITGQTQKALREMVDSGALPAEPREKKNGKIWVSSDALRTKRPNLARSIEAWERDHGTARDALERAAREKRSKRGGRT